MVGTKALFVVAILLAGCAAPGTQDDLDAEPLDAVNGGQGRGGGGVVRNVAPVVESFQAGPATVENAGLDAVVLNGTLLDRNGEKDLRRAVLNLTWTGVASGSTGHEVTREETEATSGTPAADGWTVWSGADDGLLHFQYAYTVARGTPAGDLAFQASVDPIGTGQQVVVGPVRTVEVLLYSELTVDGIFLANGTPAGDVWGGWAADPGATNVSSNILRISNTGLDPDTIALIDFTDVAFTGADATSSIPIDGNIRFGWWEDATPADGLPGEGTFTWVGGRDGAVSVPLTGVGNVVYVTYRIDKLPDILADQTYDASFTVTDL